LKRRSLVQAHGSLPGMHWVAALLHSLQHISSEGEPQTANTQHATQTHAHKANINKHKTHINTTKQHNNI
jgi:hypothetical protein